MTTYRISRGTRRKAKALGVVVRRSKNKKKKIDVFRAGKKVASVGAIGYKDYWTLLREEGVTVARERRRLYKKRHQKNRQVKGSNGYWADQLLW